MAHQKVIQLGDLLEMLGDVAGLVCGGLVYYQVSWF